MLLNILFFVGVFMAATSMMLLAVLTLDQKRAPKRRRLARFAVTAQSPLEEAEAEDRPSRGKILGSLPSDKSYRHRIAMALQRAGGKLSLHEAVMITFALGGGVAALAVLVLGLPPVLGLMWGLVAGLGGVFWLVSFLTSRRDKVFVEGLPDALDTLVRGLRTGRSITASIDMVVKNGDGPVRDEFAICHDELRFGMSLQDALVALARRVPLPEVQFFSVSTALQAETGGNLVETMENLAHQLRQRRQVRLKVKALSAEARASAMILGGLPFVVSILISIINPQYLRPLLHDPRGQVMLVAGLVSLAVGIYVMIRLGKIDA